MKKPVIATALKLFPFLVIIAIAFQSYSGKTEVAAIPDTINTDDIKANLRNTKVLLYPLSTNRIYAENKNKPIWLSPASSGDDINQALLLLDCALRYGLDQSDYHPDDFTYANIKQFAEQYNPKLAARFDVMLTDAMLGFINHLHYGKLNPVYKAKEIDAADFKGVKADSILKKALRSGDFISIIEDAQPANKEYRDLQEFLSLITGEYYGEVKNETIKRVIVNLERWRWETPENKVYALINIPGSNLRYYENDSYQEFKVIIGTPSAPTPVLSGNIGWFITYPKKLSDNIFFKEILPLLEYPNFPGNADKSGNILVPRPKDITDVIRNQPDRCNEGLGSIVFSFPGNSTIHLHARPGKSFQGTFSNGCILIERAEDFAELLLKTDSASQIKLAKFHRSIGRSGNKDFILKTPVPTYTRYFTCEINKDALIEYKDVYLKDEELFDKLFKSGDPLQAEIQEFIKKKEVKL